MDDSFKACSMEDYKKEKEFLQEIENYIKLIFDILNKNIESTIEQRNDIYKYIKTTDFSDNSYFLNIKEEILKIINKDPVLLEEYNNFNDNDNKSGGNGFKNIATAAFLGFASLVNSITYHANPSDYANSVAELKPISSLVTIGNSLGSCGFGSMAVVHGNKLNLDSSQSFFTGNKDTLENNIFKPTLGITINDYDQILNLNGLPNATSITFIENLPLDKAKSAFSTKLSKGSTFIQKVLSTGKTTGEYRTMMTGYNLVDGKFIYCLLYTSDAADE